MPKTNHIYNLGKGLFDFSFTSDQEEGLKVSAVLQESKLELVQTVVEPDDDADARKLVQVKATVLGYLEENDAFILHMNGRKYKSRRDRPIGESIDLISSYENSKVRQLKLNGEEKKSKPSVEDAPVFEEKGDTMPEG